MKRLTTLFLLLILWSCETQNEKDQQLLSERIGRIEIGIRPVLQIEGQDIPEYSIEARLRELGIPGVSIAIINEGKLDWARGYGMADSAENRPVTAETMFLAGSISKPVSALRAHQLAEEGKIDLDANVNDYLSSWKLPDNEFTETEKVTIRRILNHTAGLTVWGFPGYDKGDTIPTVPQVLDGEGNTDAVRVYQVPGQAWQYSGGGYTVMQQMITDVEAKPFPELMQTHVLNPLGMTASTFENPLPEKYHTQAATGYRMNGDEVEGKWPIYPEMAAAGLWTTPSQLVMYGKEVQQIYQNQQDGLLKASTVKEMLTPGMNEWGLGPVLTEHTFGHNGADEGFRAELIAWKERPVSAVIMVNSDNGSIIQEIKLAIAREYNLPGVEPTLRTLHPLTTEDLEKFTGKFKIPNLGEVEMIIRDGNLVHLAPFAPEPIVLLPTSELKFFNKANGAYLEFHQEGDAITGFTFYGFEAARVE